MSGTVAIDCCPDRSAWAGFLIGSAAADTLQQLGDHLDECESCQAVLATVADADDPLIAELRAGTPDPFEAEPACRDVVARLRGLVPGDADPAPPLPVPERLGEYRVLEPLGRDGMGAVYRAVHARLGRAVALKTAHRTDAAARFRRETSAHGRLDHPNVVRATDAGEAGGVAYLVMDLVDGTDLARFVKACGPLPVADACEAARQAAAGLGHLAGRGVVHRDVKPSNLMLTRAGVVQVLDLGLAAVAEVAPDDSPLTAAGQVVGTWDYLAPEQADPAGPVDARADVYGLGCTLFFLLTGSPPYPQAATVRAKVLAHAAAPVPDARDRRPDVPAALSAVVRRMMAKEPAGRFPTAAAAAAALAPFAAGSDLAALMARFGGAAGDPLPFAPSLSAATAFRSGRPRWRTRAAGVAAAGVLLTTGGLATVIRSRAESLPGPAASLAAPVDAAAEADAGPTVYPVGVVGFEAFDAPDKALGPKLTDLLATRLAARPGLTLVSRTDLTRVLDELALGAAGATRPQGAARVGHLTGAKLLVSGSVVRFEKKVYLGAKVIGVETGQVVAAEVEGVASDDLAALVTRLADQVTALVQKDAARLAPKVVAVDRVAAVNKALGAAPRPVVMVRVTERHVGSPTTDPAVQTEVTRFCTAAGFRVVDADAAGPSQADVLIRGEGFSEVAGRVGPLAGVRARVELNAVDRRTGTVLAADAQTAVAVGAAEQVAGKQALQDAAAQLAERLLPKLAPPAKK